MMRKLIALSLLLLSISSYSQSKLGYEVGYKFKNANNAKIGLSYKFREDFSSGGGTPIRIPSYTNVSLAYLTDFDNRNYVMAGIQEVLWFIELGLYVSTKKDLEPTLGINLENRIKANVGYNIAFDRRNNITLGFSYAFGSRDYYVD